MTSCSRLRRCSRATLCHCALITRGSTGAQIICQSACSREEQGARNALRAYPLLLACSLPGRHTFKTHTTAHTSHTVDSSHRVQHTATSVSLLPAIRLHTICPRCRSVQQQQAHVSPKQRQHRSIASEPVHTHTEPRRVYKHAKSHSIPCQQHALS
jgi:hypothetical protein